MAIGIAASAPVLVAGWPLWATFVSWGIGGFGMGLLFNPTTVTAMSHAQDGTEGLVGGQVSLADAIGFSTMGGIGGATVAIAESDQVVGGGCIGDQLRARRRSRRPRHRLGVEDQGRSPVGGNDRRVQSGAALAGSSQNDRSPAGSSPIDTCTSTWPGRGNWIGARSITWGTLMPSPG